MRGLRSCWRSIPHSGSAIWTFGYRTEDVPRPLDAFGFLVPKRERNTIMACTWVATKWEGRVPEGKAVLRCFSTDPDVSEEAMRSDLRRLMGITAEPLFALNHRWPESMPQYTVGHAPRIAEMEARVAAIPGLHLAGKRLSRDRDSGLRQKREAGRRPRPEKGSDAFSPAQLSIGPVACSQTINASDPFLSPLKFW